MFAFDHFYHCTGTALFLHCTALHFSMEFTVHCSVLYHRAALSTTKHQRSVFSAPYWIKEHSSVLHQQYWTVQNIQCSTVHFIILQTTQVELALHCMLYNDAQCLPVGREASLSLLFRTRAPGQIVMHNKRSLHSNQKVQHFRNILSVRNISSFKYVLFLLCRTALYFLIKVPICLSEKHSN